MENILNGRARRFGDDINTDYIIAGKYTKTLDFSSLAEHLLEDLFPGFSKTILPGDMIVAGRNFGCGSSREHAPIALGAAGAKAVVAESYARIFFRNSVATGEIFPLESQTRLCEAFKTGDEAEIDMTSNTLTRLADGAVFPLKPIGAVAPVIAAGGMFAYAREIGMIKK